jgi:hypothetical protein
MFEKRSTAEHFPHLSDGSAWSVIKLQFVAAASLFKSKAMLRRVALATVTMFFQQWTVSYSYHFSACQNQGTDQHSLGYQCSLVLRSSDLQRPGSIRQHNIALGKWCRRHRHVVCNHTSRCLRGQTRPQAHPHRRRHRNGHMPHHHRSHLREEREPVGDSQGCWLGCRGDGLALCGPLRLQLGSLRLDHHC